MTKQNFFITADVRPGTNLRELANQIRECLTCDTGMTNIRVAAAQPEFPEPGPEATEEYQRLYQQLQMLEEQKDICLQKLDFEEASRFRDAANRVSKLLREILQSEGEK